MNVLKIAFLSLLLSVVSCDKTVKTETASETETATIEAPAKFKYWNWITVGHKKSDSAYTAHFNKLKSNGIDAVLMNTGADPKLLKRLAPLANKAGLEVHAWMFTTNRPGDSIALQHPEWYMVSRSGKSCFDERPYVNYYQWLSPSHPEARKHILSLVEGLAKVEGVASVHLDYIRYPDIYLPIGLLPKYDLKQEEELPDFDFDYSDASVEKFMALHHKDPRKMENPAIDIEWKNFRLNEIKSLVNEAYDVVHKHNKKLSAAVFPYPEMADHMVRQRWDKWKIDMVLPMIYYNFYNEELDWIGYATKQGIDDLEGRPTELHTGLYTPKLSVPDLKSAIQLAKDNGAKGVAFFDDYSMSDEQFEVIKNSKE
ncbi:hypothetical protein JCM19274_2856 [Algibacter lectus]|uniref:Glycosyl hydrolase-like 10 domain-containing protein n=1 Tax=Algibacter lectus TaxID=221126 RepID=A0A090X6U1_9FLAO|nr:family 10 glycosylhydrolase [Algibacter lectus]GAL81872.1 hypothetical protein JCM19274_2856 [Algibacter lectus]